MTSIHRKIGDLYEDCVRQIIERTLSLPPGKPRYSARISSGDKVESRTIDAHIHFEDVDVPTAERLQQLAAREAAFRSIVFGRGLNGMGFEIRHCYQSADSKRIQADEAMGRHLAAAGILPVMLVFCEQSNRGIMTRYSSIWSLHEGTEAYGFLRVITGFDFVGFLTNHANEFGAIVEAALLRLRE